jgi:hypothetical protein
MLPILVGAETRNTRPSSCWRFAPGCPRRTGIWAKYPTLAEIRRELRGRDLACWCPLDQPCHADVLLEIVNSES